MSKEVLNVIVLPGIVILINLLILLFIEIKYFQLCSEGIFKVFNFFDNILQLNAFCNSNGCCLLVANKEYEESI